MAQGTRPNSGGNLLSGEHRPLAYRSRQLAGTQTRPPQAKAKECCRQLQARHRTSPSDWRTGSLRSPETRHRLLFGTNSLSIFAHLRGVLDLLMEKVIIVGSGCAGLTAAIYAGRANLSPLVLEGRQPGGQLSTTTLVENFPGFPDGIDGPELILNMHRQAEKFGARFSYAEVSDFDVSNKFIRVKADDEWLETQALIIASGASARYLNLEDEAKLIGHGLTSCATCDGAFYKNVPVAVVGGGDSAAEESLFLTRFASKVYLIHRRDKMRASKIMADRVFANKKIEPIWNTVVTKYVADEKGEMRAVMMRNVKTNQERELAVAAVFVAIGHDPNTKAYRGKLETDPDGYLIARNLAESKHPGVFIAGDVADRVYKQAVTAAGSGCAAAMDAERYLSELER